MEWYYTVLLIFLAFLVIIGISVYLLRHRIFNWIMATILGLYIVSPLDLLPDFIPVAGWGDDIGALIFMIGFIINGIRVGSKFKKKNKKQNPERNIFTEEDEDPI